MEKIIKGMANASEAIDNNFEELSQAKTSHDTRLTTVEQNVDLLQLDAVKKLYGTGTTLTINAVKNNWNTFIVNSSNNPTTTYQIRVAGNRLGIAVVAKTDDSNGTVLLIDASGTSVHTLANGSWS